MANGPATAAPIGISIAITEALSAGSTIQLKPWSTTARSADVSGFSARPIARRISISTSRTASSLHDAGSPCATDTAFVTAKSRPFKTTSTLNVIRTSKNDPWRDVELQRAAERVGVGQGLAADEVATDVGRGLVVAHAHRAKPRQPRGHTQLRLARFDRHDDRRGQQPRRDGGFERPKV